MTGLVWDQYKKILGLVFLATLFAVATAEEGGLYRVFILSVLR